MSTYQPGIPTGTINLSVDYQNIKGNFQQLDTSFGVDHVPFSNQTAQNGYHTSIHFNPVSTTVTNPPNNQPVVAPTTVAGFGQLFSAEINDGVNTDESLYFLTGGNRLIQLTRNFQPVLSANGYTFLPGGIILQWGTVTIGTSSTIINYSSLSLLDFPNNSFGVQLTRNGGLTGASVSVSTHNNSSFTANSSTSQTYFFTSMGN